MHWGLTFGIVVHEFELIKRDFYYHIKKILFKNNNELLFFKMLYGGVGGSDIINRIFKN